MTTFSDGQACMILNMVDHVGPVSVRRMIDRLGSAAAILESSESTLKSIEGIGLKSARAITTWKETVAWEKEFDAAEKLGLRLITVQDAEYPAHLREIHDPPLVLYVRGNLAGGLKHSIAVVGMRRPTHYGRDQARRFGAQIAATGMSVVSGLAMGIDTHAHEGCLDVKGHTVAVLGFGFEYLPKAGGAKLADRIVDQGGAVISEFPIARSPDRQTFPMRNRIVSGSTLGTLVVEAGTTSGALITAHFASEQGRQVFVIPGRIDQSHAQGCHRLIQNGAKLVMSIEDILDEFQYLIPRSSTRDEKKKEKSESLPPPTLTELEHKVLDAVPTLETDIDSIMTECNLPPSVVSSTLLVLEMKKLIQSLPGKMYLRKG